MQNQSISLEQLKFPIGKFSFSAEKDNYSIEEAIEAIAKLPERLHAVVSDLTDAQLDTPYRPEGWTVRQLVHHIADSHMNAYIRFKLILTEEKPPLKAYHQEGWANLPDSKLPMTISLQLLEALHQRWVEVLNAITNWELAGFHPEHERDLSLRFLLSMYSWHSRHHVAHITNLREREGWFHY